MNNEILERINTNTICNVTNKLKDVDVNSEFTNYIANNYDKLVRDVGKMKIDKLLAEDLVHDVYVSYVVAEENGESFDESKSKRGVMITVEQAVYGRMKGYSRNRKYHRQTESSTAEVKVKNGKRTIVGGFKEIPALTKDNDMERMTSVQRFYSQCANADSIEEVDERQSLAENLTYVLSFENDFNSSIKGFLSNLSDILEEVDNISPSLFSEFGKADEEFKEALMSVLTYSFKKPEEFKSVLDSLGSD